MAVILSLPDRRACKQAISSARKVAGFVGRFIMLRAGLMRTVRINPALSMMKRPTKPATLRADEIACLHALRSGKDRMTAIAVAAHLPLEDTNRALSALSE